MRIGFVGLATLERAEQPNSGTEAMLNNEAALFCF